MRITRCLITIFFITLLIYGCGGTEDKDYYHETNNVIEEVEGFNKSENTEDYSDYNGVEESTEKFKALGASYESERPAEIDPEGEIEPEDLFDFNLKELNRLYSEGATGEFLPDGEYGGNVLLLPGSPLNETICEFVQNLVWKGKVFDAENEVVYNKCFYTGVHLFWGDVFIGESMYDGNDSIILHYKRTFCGSPYAPFGEIRMVNENIFIGRLYLSKMFGINNFFIYYFLEKVVD